MVDMPIFTRRTHGRTVAGSVSRVPVARRTAHVCYGSHRVAWAFPQDSRFFHSHCAFSIYHLHRGIQQNNAARCRHFYAAASPLRTARLVDTYFSAPPVVALLPHLLGYMARRRKHGGASPGVTHTVGIFGAVHAFLCSIMSCGNNSGRTPIWRYLSLSGSVPRNAARFAASAYSSSRHGCVRGRVS